MTPLEYSLITTICSFVAYHIGHKLGTQTGVSSTLNYLNSQGLIELEDEEDVE